MKDVAPDHPAKSAAHENVGWKVLLRQDAGYADAGCQTVSRNPVNAPGYSDAMTAADDHATMAWFEGKHESRPTPLSKNFPFALSTVGRSRIETALRTSDTRDYRPRLPVIEDFHLWLLLFPRLVEKVCL